MGISKTCYYLILYAVPIVLSPIHCVYCFLGDQANGSAESVIYSYL